MQWARHPGVWPAADATPALGDEAASAGHTHTALLRRAVSPSPAYIRRPMYRPEILPASVRLGGEKWEEMYT